MFHTAIWTSQHSATIPPLKSIKLWAHLHGVPLDLRHNDGLSLIDGLVGDPKETDDFTKNLVSLTTSHVKVELDLTEPAPSVVEFQRESGEVVEVSVTYLWLPPTCSHCHELGHVIRNCLSWAPPENTETQAQKSSAKGKNKQKQKECPSATITGPAQNLAVSDVPSLSTTPATSTPYAEVVDTVMNAHVPSQSPFVFSVPKKPSFSKKKPSTKKPPLTSTAPSSPKNNLSPSEFMEKKKLKRSRSDPSFDSPPHLNACTTNLLKGVQVPPPPLTKSFSIPLKNSFSSFGSQGFLLSTGDPSCLDQ